MALIIKDTMINSFLENNIILTGGVLNTIDVEGIPHVDIIDYPAQGDYQNGAIVGLVKKSFIDFVVECGGVTQVTPDKIANKYGEQIPSSLLEAILFEITNGYDNYIIIPEGMSLAVAGLPIPSIYVLIDSNKDKTTTELINEHNTNLSAHTDIRERINQISSSVTAQGNKAIVDVGMDGAELSFTKGDGTSEKVTILSTADDKLDSGSTNPIQNKVVCEALENLDILPKVSESDNGKVLQVVNGVWTASTLRVYNGETVEESAIDPIIVLYNGDEEEF